MRSSLSLFNQAKAIVDLPTKHRVKLSYHIHMPSKTVNPNLNIRSHEPVLFLHGVFGSKKNYRDYCQTIANQNHTPVYSVDFRNHGDSEHAFPLVNYSTLCQDVVHFCEDHNLKKVNIVGYSLGAKVALLTLLKHPELCRSGVIIGNAPIKTPQVKVYLKAFIKALKALGSTTSIKSRDKNWRAEARAVMHKYIPDGDILQYLLRNIDIRKPKHATDYTPGLINFSIPVRHFDNKAVDEIADWPEEEVKGLKFDGPVRVIRGTQSVFIDDKGLAAYAEHFPNYSLSDLNSNHLIWAERPLQVTKIVSDFIKMSRYQTLQEHFRHVEHEQAHLKTLELEKAAHLEAFVAKPVETEAEVEVESLHEHSALKPQHKKEIPHIDVGILTETTLEKRLNV